MKIILCTIWILLMVLPVQAEDKLIFSSIKGSMHTLISDRVLSEAFERMGIEFMVKCYPAKRALLLANEGVTDGELQRIPGMAADYPNLVMLPVPINKLDGVVYTKDVEFSINGWESLRPYRVGVRRGIIFSEKGTRGMDRQIMNSYEELFEILERGVVDVIVLPRVNGMDLSKRLRLPGIRNLEPPIASYPLHPYLHKKNSHLISELTAVLQTMEKDGVINKIREKYLVELTK